MLSTRLPVLLAAALWLLLPLGAANRPERLEWFRDQGFGLFVHWSVDSQLGVVISHSLAGASEDYKERFFSQLPQSFDARRFNPVDWARLARLAGVRYLVFTAKHHSGYCMWPSATTDFSVRSAPNPRDLTGDVLKAFRQQGIAPGLYFSPDDFSWLYRHHIEIDRNRPEVSPVNNPDLMALNQAQLKELLSAYGPVDVLFLDGPPEGLREQAWRMQPEIVVTRGAMETPEQTVPGALLDQPWEACLTMGTSWQYQPRNETYKSGWDLPALPIQTRARGGNLLLNVGPKPDGELPIEQEERLRELALWMFVNSESIHGVRPWVVPNEGPVFFTRSKDASALYAIVKEPWKRGEWKDLLLHSVTATPSTTITILGQNDRVLEYKPGVNPATTWRQTANGLRIHAMRTQRLQDNGQWPNPAVLKITHPRAVKQ
ncbi:MAG: alpha-L-fucosidase [Acidobacteria bacterium]|nr:alpha-L-fucosidase [Acidobacteriota bacterium]